MLPLQGTQDSIPGWGAEILHAAWHSQKKKKNTSESWSNVDSKSVSQGWSLRFCISNKLQVMGIADHTFVSNQLGNISFH